MCGAVRVEATTSDATLSACHCEMCRQHTSSMFVSISADQPSVKVSGPAKSFRSSDWAERGFCSECGSTLWYGTVHDGARHLAAGLFANAGGANLTLEYFADQCPNGYRLEGDLQRLTRQQTIEFFTDETEGNE